MLEGTRSTKMKNIILASDSVQVTRCSSCVLTGGESFLCLDNGGSVLLRDVYTYLPSCTLSRTWNVLQHLFDYIKWNKIYTLSNTTILYFIKLIKYKIVVFDEVYILFLFNIVLKHNGMFSTKIIYWLFAITERKLSCTSRNVEFEGLSLQLTVARICSLWLLFCGR
jgi:hypothetical protein